ncbi:MAG: hydroxymethylbilane synthase [Nitriliruptor sp.]
MSGATWRLATRRSNLAQVQARQVGEALEAATGRPYELVPLATTGDEHPDRALGSFDTKGLFVDNTRKAVLAGDCHLVVHSYKDLPTEAHPELVVGGVPARVDPRDALVTRAGWRIADLPRDRQVTIGTSAPRRKAQISKHRRDVLVQPIRGNIETRLGKVTSGEVDGVVLALAGLLRARPDVPGLTAVPLEHGEVLHAPAQGALALECRTDDAATREALRAIEDEDTRLAVDAEREMLLQLQGGCTAPIGAHAEVKHGPTGEKRIELLGMVSDLNGTNLYRASHETGASEPHLLGRVMAATLLEAGGGDVLARMRAAEA